MTCGLRLQMPLESILIRRNERCGNATALCEKKLANARQLRLR